MRCVDIEVLVHQLSGFLNQGFVHLTFSISKDYANNVPRLYIIKHTGPYICVSNTLAIFTINKQEDAQFWREA